MCVMITSNSYNNSCTGTTSYISNQLMINLIHYLSINTLDFKNFLKIIGKNNASLILFTI